MRNENAMSAVTLLKISFISCSLATLSCSPARHSSSQRTSEKDRKALIFLEHEWLAGGDVEPLARFLASDFVHRVRRGFFLRRARHMVWMTKPPPPSNLRFDFDRLDVRVYGDTGIA